jgi:hypothetical protein
MDSLLTARSYCNLKSSQINPGRGLGRDVPLEVPARPPSNVANPPQLPRRLTPSRWFRAWIRRKECADGLDARCFFNMCRYFSTCVDI